MTTDIPSMTVGESKSIVVGGRLREELHREIQRLRVERDTAVTNSRKLEISAQLSAITDILGEQLQ